MLLRALAQLTRAHSRVDTAAFRKQCLLGSSHQVPNHLFRSQQTAQHGAKPAQSAALSETEASGGMELSGSCHCGAVKFTVMSHTPVPYQHCYCSICRKTAGSTGAAVNLGADSTTMKIEGETAVYHAIMDRKTGETSPAERHFCPKCGSALWLYDSRWPELIHPQAGAIDTPLPKPRGLVCLMLSAKPDWAVVPPDPPAEHFQEYPPKSIDEWHKENNCYVEGSKKRK